MAQRLLTHERTSQDNQDFSSLAWRFNNLNSTAKMLLVGASSQSVPFIPISELATTDTEQQINKVVPEVSTTLSLSQLTSPNVFNQEVTASLPAASTNGPSRIMPVKDFSVSSYSEPFSVIHTEEEKHSIQSISYRPSSITEVANPPVEVQQHSIKSEPEEQPKASLNIKAPILDTYSPASEVQGFAKPQWSPEARIDTQTTSTAWTYRSPEIDEEEYYSLKNDEENKSFFGPVVRTTVKSVAVVSLIALLGLGAYNLLKKYNEKGFDNKAEQDSLTGSGEDSTYSSEKIDGAYSSSKSFIEEENKSDSEVYSQRPSEETKISSHSPAAPHTYYHPTVRSTKNTIKVSKPKIYTAPSGYTASPKAAPIASTNPYADPSPTIFLYDPSTVYDSSAEDSIKPLTFTAERFPVEISYPHQNEQYQASFNTSSYSVESEAPSSSQETNAPQEKTPYTDEVKQAEPTRVNSGYPASEEATDSTLQVPQRVSSGYPLNQNDLNVSPSQQATDLTPEEKAIISSPDKFEGRPTQILKPTSNPYAAPQAGVNAPEVSTPIYSKPLNTVPTTSSNDESSDNETSGVPILREPMQSSSNALPGDSYNSPYKTSNTPTTTSNIVPQQMPSSAAGDTTYSKNYTQAKKGKISRLFGRNKQTTPSNASSTSTSPYQSSVNIIQQKAQAPTTPLDEKGVISSKVNISRNTNQGNTASNSSSNSFPRWKAQSDISKQNLDRLESDASNVYVHPSPYGAQDGYNGVNISSL